MCWGAAGWPISAMVAVVIGPWLRRDRVFAAVMVVLGVGLWVRARRGFMLSKRRRRRGWRVWRCRRR